MRENTPLTDPVAEDAALNEHPPESGRKTLRSDIRYGASLVARYVKGDPLLGSLLIGAQIGSGGLASVLFLRLQTNLASITNALAAKNGNVINGLLLEIVIAAIVLSAIGMVTIWAQLTLRIRFRRVLTDHLLTRWISSNNFYKLERKGGVDYPEQRIQEDIYQFIEKFLTIAPQILFSFFAVFLYTAQLWKMSPPIVPSAMGVDHPIPGLLVYAAFSFAIIWTILTHIVGKSLTRVEVVRQRLEAQFRQEMGAVRENSESIAFARGGPIEEERLTNTFGLIRKNWRFYTWANLKISFVTGMPSSFMIVAPSLICAPFVLKGQMQVGDVALVGASFNQVYMGLGILVTQYADLAIFRSSVARLRLIDEALSQDFTSEIQVNEHPRGNIGVRNLGINFPDGQVMSAVGDLDILPSRRLLVQGRSGAGKSTLLRTIAGLWPYGAGEVSLPSEAKIAFLPQRGYMPNSSLAGLMSYPLPSDTHSDETYIELLNELGLSRFVSKLHDYQAWSRILSPGEQQRIAAARALLAAPDYLFVDEATSALDPDSEKKVYSLFTARLPRAALISVAHRPSVAKFHDDVLRLDGGKVRIFPAHVVSES